MNKEFQCYYENGILEIVDIDGSDAGFSIEFDSEGKANLFELTGMNTFNAGKFDNVYDALKKALSWT